MKMSRLHLQVDYATTRHHLVYLGQILRISRVSIGVLKKFKSFAQETF
jgi:hypothetical protein